jgi:uncharacterized protein (TIGR02246 family)
MSDEGDIRQLIEDWARAVGRQDMNGILDRHTADILMFDVPPPNEVEGLEAYRRTWEPFFDHFRRGGMFEIVKLNVTAGDRVAYATALLRCGTHEELAKDKMTRLRLTVGLRKIDDRWHIAHEHHSFPLRAT